MKCDALNCENNTGMGYCENGGPSRVDENALCMDYFPIERKQEEDEK